MAKLTEHQKEIMTLLIQVYDSMTTKQIYRKGAGTNGADTAKDYPTPFGGFLTDTNKYFRETIQDVMKASGLYKRDIYRVEIDMVHKYILGMGAILRQVYETTTKDYEAFLHVLEESAHPDMLLALRSRIEALLTELNLIPKRIHNFVKPMEIRVYIGEDGTPERVALGEDVPREIVLSFADTRLENFHQSSPDRIGLDRDAEKACVMDIWNFPPPQIKKHMAFFWAWNSFRQPFTFGVISIDKLKKVK